MTSIDTPVYSGFVEAPSVDAESAADFELIMLTATSAVYRCTVSGRRRIYKSLAPGVASGEPYRRLLQKEWSVLSQLSHPAIVSAYSFRNIDGIGDMIEMEWIDGMTLADWLRTIRSYDIRCKVALQLLDAVAYIHSKGVVHRDIKPENIMVTHDGDFVKLIDFGLADTCAHTGLKNPAGTPGYMSEHQQQSYSPLTSDDIYALRLVLAEILPSEQRWLSRKGSVADAMSLSDALQRRWRRKSARRILVPTVAVSVMVVAGLLGRLWQLNGEVSVLAREVEVSKAQVGVLDERLARQTEESRLKDQQLVSVAQRQRQELDAMAGRRNLISDIIKRRTADLANIWESEGEYPLGESYEKHYRSEMFIRQWVDTNPEQLTATELSEVETALRRVYREMSQTWKTTHR